MELGIIVPQRAAYILRTVGFEDSKVVICN